MSDEAKTNAEWLELAGEYCLRHPMKTHPLVPVRGEGVYMWDAEGKKYLDFMSGQLCCSLGHSHPEFVESIREQAGIMVQAGTTFSVPSEILLAKKIAELAPDPLKRSLFACTGSESNEMALRVAKKATGRHETVGVAQNYHGSTMGSASAGGLGGFWREGYAPFLAGACVVPLPYYYRLPMCQNDGASTDEADDYLLHTTREIINAGTTGRPAAFILEPLMGSAGMLVPSKKWTQGIREICNETGALMVIDEALTGWGRTGKWLCFEHFDIVPDIVTTSKGLGAGMSICAITTTDEICERALDNGFMHFSSHSGDPLLCAPSLKNLEIIERDDLCGNAGNTGGYFLERLKDLEARYEIIGEARGLGFILGLETVTDKKSRTPNPEAAGDIAEHCFQNGLWLTNVRPQMAPDQQEYQHRHFPMNIVRFMPPLTTTRGEVDAALGILEAAVQYAQDRSPRPTQVALG